MRALEQLVERIRSTPGLWLASAEQVARHVRTLGLVPRAFPRPVLDGEGGR
jgi:hypothetical protein